MILEPHYGAAVQKQSHHRELDVTPYGFCGRQNYIWVVAPCSLMEVLRRFVAACCLHHRPHDGRSNYL